VSGARGTAEPAMRLEDLDFELPEELVAQRPLAVRDACRLLCVRRERPGTWTERVFHDLPDLLRPGDVLVRNTTRVLPARLEAIKEGSGTRCEVLLLEPDASREAWWALVRPGRRLRAGALLRLADDTRLEVRAEAPDGRRLVAGQPGSDLAEVARRVGRVPLPPYIRRPADAADRDDYQTVYAERDGSVAAPTAGLHFTPELIDKLKGQGIGFAYLTLHVGLDTFAPVTEDDPSEHIIHTEWCELGAEAADQINRTRRAGGRVIAVGTTTVRTLESAAVGAKGDDIVAPFNGPTSLFILPGYQFKAVDAMVTNFHLPKSTLLMLVSAFAGRERILSAYGEALDKGYRFFSYGDAMLIL